MNEDERGITPPDVTAMTLQRSRSGLREVVIEQGNAALPGRQRLMTPPAEAEQDSPLTAMIGTVADGQPVMSLNAVIARLMGIDRALKSGLSWAQVGSVYRMSGKEMKRETRALNRRVQRELIAAKGKGKEL